MSVLCLNLFIQVLVDCCITTITWYLLQRPREKNPASLSNFCK